MAHRNADSVLPDPVGAMTSVCSPAAMARHAPSWASVGAGKAPSNHSRVAVENSVMRSVCTRADRKSTRLNSSHVKISYAVFCLKKKSVLHSWLRFVYGIKLHLIQSRQLKRQ